ncbi:MAG: N-acyl homoserine lactonase family protein [Candidatus Puniceispirillaceae bacterium]
MSDKLWEVFAVKYAMRNTRTRQDSFMFDPHHSHQHDMDYFIWVLRSDKDVILVDTGYDEEEAERRNRPILRNQHEALKALSLAPETIQKVIITHLHYDHAGSLASYPNATFYVHPDEMAYATGPCMCEDVLRMPYSGSHICDAITALYSGRLCFTQTNHQIADGVSVHRIGGHSRGLQAVRVKTASGWLCLASDAAHYYENFILRKPFPIVVDLADMYQGYDLIQSLASTPSLVIPGHDPLVCSLFPDYGQSGFVWRLDKGTIDNKVISPDDFTPMAQG